MPYADPRVQSDYQNEHGKIRSARERKRLMALIGGKCVICGAARGLEFHHKEPANKNFTIGNALRFTPTIREQEALKCELRCEQHHHEIHAPPHGTASKYRGGCRCGPCIDGKRRYHRDWMRQWRIRKGQAQGCSRSLQD